MQQGINMYKILLGITMILLISGCSGVRRIQIPTSETEGEWVSEVKKDAPANASLSKDRMYVRKKESKYIIKEEPYSIASKKKDPELLGPQRTYSSDEKEVAEKAKQKKKSTRTKMTKESCISLIGEVKYNKYVQKYGGEAGALRRCLVLQRLRG